MNKYRAVYFLGNNAVNENNPITDNNLRRIIKRTKKLAEEERPSDDQSSFYISNMFGTVLFIAKFDKNGKYERIL